MQGALKNSLQVVLDNLMIMNDVKRSAEIRHNFSWYKKYLRGVILPHDTDTLKSLSYWKNEIFFRILIYFTPLSIIALIPGVYMSFTANAPVVGCVDLFCFLLLIVIMTKKGLSLQARKSVFIAVFYLLSVTLIYYLGTMGPGLLFLLTITILSSIISSASAGYYSAIINTLICFAFGALNFYHNRLHADPDHSFGAWIAVSSNLVVLSFASAKCLNVLLGGLSVSLNSNITVEEKLKKINRLYHLLSQVNQGIVLIKDEEALYRSCCRIALETGKFKMAWIGRVDEAEKRIVLIEQGGIPEDERHLFNTPYHQGGPQESVLSKETYFVCNNIQEGIALKAWEPFVARHNIRSFMILPVKKEGVVSGTLNLYSTEPGFFDTEEIKLLVEATENISFALDVFRKDAEHRQMEELQGLSKKELLRVESRLNEAQAIAHLGSWELNFETNVGIWSKEACRIYGLSPEDKNQSYESWLSFIHPADLDSVLKITAENRETLTELILNHRIVLRDGTVKHIYSRSRFEFDKKGNPVGIYGIAQDVTERRAAEEEREKIIFNLVQHSKKLEQFAYIVSHNLRAPVAHIMGLSNVLKSDVSASDRAQCERFLFQATEQMDEVLKDLNKVLALKSEISEQKEPLMLDELVSGIKSDVQGLIKSESVEIMTDFNSVNKITSIKSYIHSIFNNLILNSIKFKQQGRVSLIKIKSEMRGERIILSFKDNGIGIDLIRNRDQIFGIYKRFHLAKEGKGLGLFMVKTQVEALGGTIRVESKEDEGAEFIIELPL
ncbi:MAG: hypothetical protein JWO09_1885 [Bacteroidetes bacterium]|nr:hypothetical protein [Bacteroidota bacterium]